MTVRQLARFIDARRRAGADVASLATKLYLKPAAACSALLLTLLGLPFAFRYGRRGAVADRGGDPPRPHLLLRDVVVREARRGGRPPPVLAAGPPNALFGLGAAYGLLGVRT